MKCQHKPNSVVVKIAFIVYDYYPFGGLQDDCLKTAIKIAGRGHETHIFTRTWKGDQPSTLKIELLGKHGWTNTSRNESFFKQLEIKLRAGRFDGIVAFNRVPGADIYFAADPCYAARMYGCSFSKKIQPRHRYYLALEKRVFARTDAPETLVLTEKEIDAFQSFYQIDRSKFHCLPPGVARVTYQPEEAARHRCALRAELGCPQDAEVALFVGSGFRIKGLDRALKAIKANSKGASKLEFWVVGNDKPNRYKKLIETANVPVRLLGGRADVDRFYQAADFLLHPAYSESAGKVLLEAITHGLPVLTTDTCGYGFHIEQAEAGIVIKSPFVQEALNIALAKFLSDKMQRTAWSKSALRYASKEDLYSCHESSAKIIEEILSKH